MMEATMVHDWPWAMVEATRPWAAMEAAGARPTVRTGKGTNRNGRNANRNYEFLVHFCLLS